MWHLLSLRRLRTIRLTGYWRAFVIALAACAVIGTLVVALAPELAGIFLFGLYAIPSNSVIPIPHEPGLLYFAKYYHPVWIAFAGTLGSAVVCFADYAIVKAALRHPRIHGATEARVFRWAVRWMTRIPFVIVFLFALIPLPVSVIRVLAPVSGYPIGRYVVAQSLGRFPRFLVLAWIGHTVDIPGWVILALFAALAILLYLSSRSVDEVEEDAAVDEAAEEIVIPDLSDPEHPGAGVSASIPRSE